MTLPKKTDRVYRSAKHHVGASAAGQASAVESLKRTAAQAVTVVDHSAPLSASTDRLMFEDAVPSQFCLQEAPELLHFRLQMIFDVYQRNWSSLEATEREAIEKLRQLHAALIPEAVLDLKLAALDRLFLRTKATLNSRLVGDIGHEISKWSGIVKAEVTETSQRVLRICTASIPVASVVFPTIFFSIYLFISSCRVYNAYAQPVPN